MSPPEMQRAPTRAPSKDHDQNSNDANPTMLAAAANKEHRLGAGAAVQAMTHWHRAGEHLRKAQEAVGHGKWMAWVEKHCKFSHRTATRYMQIAEAWPALSAKLDTLANLTLTGVTGLLAKPKPDPVAEIGALFEFPDPLETEPPAHAAALEAHQLTERSELVTIVDKDHLAIISSSAAYPGWYWVEKYNAREFYAEGVNRAVSAADVGKALAVIGIQSDAKWTYRDVEPEDEGRFLRRERYAAMLGEEVRAAA